MAGDGISDRLVGLLTVRSEDLSAEWAASVTGSLGGRVSRAEVQRELQEIYTALVAALGSGSIDGRGRSSVRSGLC